MIGTVFKYLFQRIIYAALLHYPLVPGTVEKFHVQPCGVNLLGNIIPGIEYQAPARIMQNPLRGTVFSFFCFHFACAKKNRTQPSGRVILAVRGACSLVPSAKSRGIGEKS